jgi:hypothetical protein
VTSGGNCQTKALSAEKGIVKSQMNSVFHKEGILGIPPPARSHFERIFVAGKEEGGGENGHEAAGKLVCRRGELIEPKNKIPQQENKQSVTMPLAIKRS